MRTQEDAVNKADQTIDLHPKLREYERERNRLRVSEIWSYVERQRADIRRQFEDVFAEDSEEEDSEAEPADD